MKNKNGSKRPKTPYIGLLITCPIFAIWFFVYGIMLIMQKDVGWAIYSLVCNIIWTFLFGFNFANHLNWKRSKKIQNDVLEHFKLLEMEIQQENEKEPFEEFNENKFTLDE